MADTVSFDSLLNTTSDMNAIVNNTKHDDDTISITGVSWFTYAGKTVSTIYVSGNNFVGFGQQVQQLKICSRDGAIYYIYRQEGILESGRKFLKIRVEGFTYYSSTSEAYAVKYEIFLIEGQTLFINVIKVPSNSSYIGASSITDGTTMTTLDISTTSTVPIYVLVQDAGSAQKISYEKYFDTAIIGISVASLPTKTTYYQKEFFDSTGLNVVENLFDGSTNEITDYELSGFDSATAGVKTITVTSGRFTTTFEITVSEETLTGIVITTPPNKTGYHIDSIFETGGIVVSATTSDGKTILVSSNQLEYSGFDSSSPGNKTITVTYNGFAAEFIVVIMTPVSISYEYFFGTSYFVGDESTVTVYSISATYSDGITDKNIKSGYTVSQVDTSTAGQKISVVDYFGITAEIPVVVLDSYSVQLGTPNAEDVTATLDLSTGVMNILGTGKFLPIRSVSNTPNSIGDHVKVLNVGEGITNIPDQMFPTIGLINLEQISFPSTLNEIGGANFNSLKVAEIVFPQSLQKIGGSCFNNCSSLQKVTFHEGLESIGGASFNECRMIKNLGLPSTLKDMSYSFQDSVLEKLEVGGDEVNFKSSGSNCISNIYAKNLVIRGGTIYGSAFSQKNIETLSLDGTVKWDGTGQFNSCKRLTDISIGYGITNIPIGCFDGCTSLDNVELPDSITEIGDMAFSGCISLKKITLSKKLKAISNACFYGCAFRSFTIPDDSEIESIGNAVFNGCSNLSTVYIGKSVKTIGDGGFAGTTSLTISINQPENAISGSPWSASNATIEWNATEKELKNISISKFPKTSYIIHETFDLTGLEVVANYSDGSSKEISDYRVSDISTNTPGTKTVTITYKDEQISFGVTVYDIESIKVSERFGTNQYFFIGDENTGNYRYAAKTLVATYENDEERTVAYGDFTETEVDTSQAGTFYTTVKYLNLELRNPYTVYGSPFITTAGYPNNEDVTLTLNLDTGLCVVEGTGIMGRTQNAPRSYSDKVKTMEIKEGITGLYRPSYLSTYTFTLLSLPSTIETISDSDMSSLLGIVGSEAIIRINAKKDSVAGSPWGQKYITVIWTAKPEKLVVVSPPTKTKYTIGDTFDSSGIECKIQYTNKKEYTPDGELSFSEVDMSQTGKQLITVSCTEEDTVFSAKFGIEILSSVIGIRISQYPSKLYYKVGENLDLSGLKVVKISGTGNESEITDYSVSGFNSSKIGTSTVQIMYTESSKTFSTSFKVNITKDGEDPFSEDEPEQINVTVHWIDGEFKDLTNEHIQNNTLTLQESICSESYFIFGGCVSNQITFQAHHEQFDSTDEEAYPSGRIEVYLERKGTKIKIFTGEIASADRQANSLTRNFIAYDYLYKLRNTDIARWYKNYIVNENKILTQKQFRDALFNFLGIEQVETTLHWDNAYVPNLNNSNEINTVTVLKDLCLQNDRFGWMNRDGKFEYLKLKENSYRYGTTTAGKAIYKYYNNDEIHLDTFKSFSVKEGRVWFPYGVLADPDPNRAYGFTAGEPSAQEAYEQNIYYNRNSFFIGNEDWLNFVWDADEYNAVKRSKPIMDICYGMYIDLNAGKFYRARGYTAEVAGNPFNMVGQRVELHHSKQIQHDEEEPVELKWYVHSYIMSRTLKVGITDMVDTYSANNAPFNSNSQQLGKYTPEISGTVNVTRSEMPTISYAEFSDGSDSGFTPQAIDDFVDSSDSTEVKKTQLRCMKRIKKSDYDALVAAGTDRKDTLYFTYEES